VNNPETEPTPENTSAEALREAAVNGSMELRRKTTRDAFATRLFLVIVAGSLIIGALFAYKTLRAVRATQHSAYSIQQQTRACVTPGTACYRQTQQQNKALITAIVAGVVGGINESSLYYSYCAARPGPPTLHDIKTCANRLLHPR
jgi:hypothetical protein